MDQNLLLDCFSATLQVNYSIRQQAELQLRQLVSAPGFLGACLNIMSSDSRDINLAIKKAAAVYFKNQVVKFWANDTDNRIDDDEKPIIKERLLPVIISSDYHIKQQLIPVLRLLVSYDYPQKWPSLLEDTVLLLQQVPVDPSRDEEYAHLYTGLLALSEVSRKFRWVTNEDRSSQLDPIITNIFPHLLDLGNSIIQNPQGITEFTAEILKLILKIYKFVTYYDLPHPLQNRDSLIAWGSFHGSIMNMSPPYYVINSSASDQEKSLLQISKCYKWSIANIYRLFQRYASSNLSKKFHYNDFRQMFTEEYLPHLVPTLFSLIEMWCTKERWLCLSFLYYLLQFLSHCVSQDSTWVLVESSSRNLVAHLIFPLLCSSDYVLDLFENDPQEYIHLNYDIYDSDSPDTAALGLLVTLVDKRLKYILDPIIAFVVSQFNVLQQQEENLDVAKGKEGSLRIMGGISHYLTIPQSPYCEQMEPFLLSYVFPNLNSKFEFLRARTLEVILKFSDIEFKEGSSIAAIVQGMLGPFESTEEVSLPIYLEASLGIQAFIHIEDFRQVLSGRVVNVMGKLLELSNEIDNDALSMVMQECVENFSEQLQPFGIHLMRKLVEQFMRLAVELNEASKLDVDDFTGDYDDNTDKIRAAIGLLNTMITVLLSFETSQEVCRSNEETFSAAVEFVLGNRMDDFMTEVGELIENSTFLLRSISPCMWKCFDLLYDCFEDGIALMYLEELIQCLRNYILYGLSDIQNNPQLISKFYNIFKIITNGDEDMVDYNDIVFACEFIQTFVLSLQSYCITYHEEIVSVIISKLHQLSRDTHHVRNSSFDVNTNNVFLSMLIYNPQGTLVTLNKCQYLAQFFERWFALIPLLNRVYDLKLSILSLISICDDNAVFENLNSDISSKIGPALATLLGVLPRAIELLEKKRAGFDPLSAAAEDSTNAQWNTGSYSTSEQDTITNVNLSDSLGSNDYVNFLLHEDFKLKSAGFYDEDDDQVIEDPLVSTPLDEINTFKVFKDFVQSLSSTQPNKYHTLFSLLSDEQQKVCKDVFEIVD